MTDHEFTLILSRVPTDPELEELFEAGCDDATFGVRNRIAHATFTRHAKTLEAAVVSATKAIQSVGGLQVLRVEYPF